MSQEALSVSELTILGPGALQNRIYSGPAAPTSGSFQRGDLIFNSSPAEGSPTGWRCLASGYPGTWEEFSGGAGEADGGGIDETQTVAAITRIFDISNLSRPVSVDISVGGGDSLDMFTTEDTDALYDENHASWTEARATSTISTIESVLDTSIVGVRVRRTSGTSTTSSVRVYAPVRGAGYNPVFNPLIDAAPAGLNDTRRLLDQATMGPLALEAAAFTGTYGGWIDAQFATAAPTIQPLDAGLNFQNESSMRAVAYVMFKLWTENNTSQLRIRVANAIGQIVVAGGLQPASGGPNLITWHQGLINKAFGNFRDILDHACMNRAMGWYLNNVGNSAYNIAPSQNFARELLQLFSMGTQKLNKDGTPVYLPDGQVEKAYTQADVASAARYLSGWAQRGAVVANPGANGTPANGDMETSAAVGLNLAYNGWDTPAGGTLGIWPFFGKTNVDYPVFGVFANPTNQQIIDRKNAILDIIMEQQTTGVYICKQMIQKLVTDNPTPQYVRRVYAAWEDNGSGVVGDLKAVIKAILLDREARGNGKPVTFGRAQEWALSDIRRIRYAETVPITTADAHAYMWPTALGSPSPSIMIKQGQQPALPISVFNDYPFQYDLSGTQAPAAALWGAPAMQANIGITMSFSNAAHLANPTAMAAFDVPGRWLVSALIAVYDAAYAATAGIDAVKAAAGHNALIDKVYPDLHQGDMPSTAERTEILGLLTDLHGQSIGTRSKCVWLINFVLAVPRAAVVQ